MKYLKEVWKDEEGMGVIEVMLIIVALIALALFFKENIVKSAKILLNRINTDIRNF